MDILTSNEKRVTYTEQQLNIINGKIPLDTLHRNSLQHLKKKALELGDNGTAEMIGEEIEKRKKARHQSKLIMIGPKPYTEKQMKILTGEIALEEASGKLLSHLHRKALENKDEDLSAKVKEQLDVLKKEAEKRNAERAIKRTKAVMRNEPIQWRQPKTNEYADHQKQIVRGEIPFEKIHTKELISICMKARNVGDHELAETVFDLIMDHRAESVSKRKARKKIYDVANLIKLIMILIPP